MRRRIVSKELAAAYAAAEDKRQVERVIGHAIAVAVHEQLGVDMVLSETDEAVRLLAGAPSRRRGTGFLKA